MKENKKCKVTTTKQKTEKTQIFRSELVTHIGNHVKMFANKFKNSKSLTIH